MSDADPRDIPIRIAVNVEQDELTLEQVNDLRLQATGILVRLTSEPEIPDEEARDLRNLSADWRQRIELSLSELVARTDSVRTTLETLQQIDSMHRQIVLPGQAATLELLAAQARFLADAIAACDAIDEGLGRA